MQNIGGRDLKSGPQIRYNPFEYSKDGGLDDILHIMLHPQRQPSGRLSLEQRLEAQAQPQLLRQSLE